MINFACSECEASLSTGDDNRGRRIRCPECGKMTGVPDFTNPFVTFECPECGGSVQIRHRQLGSRTDCPECKARVVSPTPEELAEQSGQQRPTRCAMCGLQAKPELRCTGCNARFCSEACQKQHSKTTPHGCAMSVLMVLLAVLGLLSASLSLLAKSF